MGSYQDMGFVYLSMEFAAGGELFSLIYNSRVNFSNELAKFYTVEILSALEMMHSLGFIYRDLRPENVLLDSEGHVKIVDFGNAKRQGEGGVCHTLLGDAEYLAPEMLAGAVGQQGAGYTNAVDFWALACLVFEMLSGRTPFARKKHSLTFADMHSDVLKGSIQWGGMGKEVKDLLQQMLHIDLESRVCTAQEVKAHSHFAGVRWDKVLARETIVPWAPDLKHTGDISHYYRFPDPNSCSHLHPPLSGVVSGAATTPCSMGAVRRRSRSVGDAFDGF